MAKKPPSNSSMVSANRLQLNLVARLLKRLEIAAGSQLCNGARANTQSAPVNNLALSGGLLVLSLAKRGLCPEQYKASIIESLIAQVMDADGNVLDDEGERARRPRIDTTEFSKACRNDLIDSFSELASRCPQVGAVLVDAARDEAASEFLRDPLLAGWGYQSQVGAIADIKERPKESAQTNASDIATLTQWFTPQWIAEFLVSEAIDGSAIDGSTSHSTTFLDPACGAGHILVSALDRMMRVGSSTGVQSKTPSNVRLTDCMERLFGLDIDPIALQLCSAALYLKARDIDSGLSELPLPKLFCVAATPRYPVECGSLLLGVDRSRLVLRQANGYEGPAEELLAERFSFIATNPPYLSHRLLPASISELLRQHYKQSCYDLYAAFIDLCLRLLADDGRFAMVCQQSFLTIQRYQALRESLLRECAIDSLVLLGSGSFSMKAGEKVNNAIIVAQKSDEKERSDRVVKHWRMFGSSEKLMAEQKGIAALASESISEYDMRLLTSSIEGAPIAPWCPASVARLFRDLPRLENGDGAIRLVNGLFTCNNQYFVAHHKEVGESDRHLYVPYDKGGGKKWYRKTPFLLRWEGDGQRIREFRASRGQSSKLPGEEFYFKAGITYSYIGTRDFKARLLSPQSVFDIASSAIFSDAVDIYYLLGFLNSTLVRYMLSILNPTINFQIGDLRRLPFNEPNKDTESAVSNLAREAVDLAMTLERYNPDSPDYAQCSSQNRQKEQPQDLRHLFEQINDREWAIQDEIDDLVFSLYRIDATTRKAIENDPLINRSARTLIAKVPRTKI